MNRRYTNVQDVPLALGVFLASDDYDYDDRPNVISATTLLQPLRQIILSKRVPQEDANVPLASMMRLRIGSAVHSAIERSWKENYQSAMEAMGYPQRVIDMVRINPTSWDPDTIPVYMEQRVEKRIGKWTVTGKYDFIAEGRVQDFKTATVWSYQQQTNFDKQKKQGSLYRWLNPTIITADEIDIHHIFLDWQGAQARTNPKYPQRDFIKQTIGLMSVQETDQFVKNKLALIDKYWDADEADIPHCNDDELWRREPVFKFYLSGDTTKRATKVFDTLHDATLFQIEKKGAGVIKPFPGQVTACKYCAAFIACSQKDLLIEAGDLVL